MCLVPGIPWTAEYWGTAQLQSAFDSYVKAASLAKDGQQRKSYADAAQRILAKLNELSTAKANLLQIKKSVDGRSADFDAEQRLAALQEQGHSYPYYSDAWRHCYVSKAIYECWDVRLALSLSLQNSIATSLLCRRCRS